MKKPILLILTLALCAAALQAQQPTMTDCFRSMPDIVIPSNRDVRLELIDFYQAKGRASVVGHFGSYLTLNELSDDYFRLQSSSVCQVEGKMLPLCDSLAEGLPADSAFVILMVRTAREPEESSRCHVYSSNWKKRSADGLSGLFPQANLPDLLPVLQHQDFWNLQMLDSLTSVSYPDKYCSDESQEINVSQLLSAAFYTYRLNPDNYQLEVGHSVEKYLGRDLYEKIAAAYTGPLVLKWNGVCFEKQSD